MFRVKCSAELCHHLSCECDLRGTVITFLDVGKWSEAIVAASRLSSKDGFAGKECECNAGDTLPGCDRTWGKGERGGETFAGGNAVPLLPFPSLSGCLSRAVAEVSFIELSPFTFGHFMKQYGFYVVDSLGFFCIVWFN